MLNAVEPIRRDHNDWLSPKSVLTIDSVVVGSQVKIYGSSAVGAGPSGLTGAYQQGRASRIEEKARSS